MPLNVKERLGNGSGSAYISVRTPPTERGMGVSKPAGEKGICENGPRMAPSSTASSEERGVMAVANINVGNSLTLGTIVLSVSARLIAPDALRFLDDPSLTTLTA